MVRTKAESQKCCTSEKMSLPDVAWAEDLAKLTWALAHPARVRIVRLLLNRTFSFEVSLLLSFSDIVDIFAPTLLLDTLATKNKLDHFNFTLVFFVFYITQ